MYESLLINEIIPQKEEFINNQTGVSDFIATTKKWQFQKSQEYITSDITDKINIFPFHLIVLMSK